MHESINNDDDGEKFTYKTLIVGDSAVGKTCFMTHFVEKKVIEESTPTIGMDFKIQNIAVQVNGRNYLAKLQVCLPPPRLAH